ncbi:comF family protein [Sulfitobacter brevis]|uniref:ComF family protein n=1 Tax=Sulfitobacter brevis TaxID=74348 RepID=A0A1I1Y5W0_9RHOB|nr:double zinc ribbon domain-containing protein [Sulfitobacter brevis]SFE14964.1 comF family protein [Sulfitobacter brevis]
MTLLAGIQTALDAIYPARCLTCGDRVDSDFGLCGPCWSETSFIGGAVCDGCGIPLPGFIGAEAAACDDCLHYPRPWELGRAALIYTGVGRKLVLALKHGDRQEIAKPAALWMHNAIAGRIPENAIIAPVPLHPRRLLRRRYNQSALLAAALAKRMEMSWCPDLLRRYKSTQTLDGMTARERWDTLHDAISITTGRSQRMIGRPVLLVDDVMTTGATLSACANACLAAGSGPISVVTLARVAKET